jgi:hypothetical protein
MTERTAYRLSEVRAALGISRATMWRWVGNGKIPITKLCGRSFVKREHLLGLLDQIEHPTPKEPSDLAKLKAQYKAEYCSWVGAKQRCRNPDCPDYEAYAGQGVSFSVRWDSFQTFMTDMGPKPTAGHSLDRWPDPAGNYEPGNCRWATAKEQRVNRRQPISPPIHQREI